MFGSIIVDERCYYPEAASWFSPHEAYPEYQFGHLSSTKNRVYESVRNSFHQIGLDAKNFGLASWNPLGQWIKPGASVFVLCNFVYHRRQNENAAQFEGKCTHGSILRAVCDYILIANGGSAEVGFGNAPLQSCNWEKVLNDTGASRVLEFYKQEKLSVEAYDLRLAVTERGFLGQTRKQLIRKGGIKVRLGQASLLSELDQHGDQKYRVSDYNPDLIQSFHESGLHEYIINEKVLRSQLIFSLPKLKTHEKVGITCGVKGMVGTVGHKDCLAHHRFGSPKTGGDEYPKGGYLRDLLSQFHDQLNRLEHGSPKRRFGDVFDKLSRQLVRKLGGVNAGAWHGNDTAWRMALDLARIVSYADPDGNLRSVPQRRHLILVDGIVAGEGNGPLSPTPVHGGAILFSDNIVFSDLLCAKLMGFNPEHIPTILKGLGSADFPLMEESKTGLVIRNGEECDLDNVPPLLGRSFRTPPGWKNLAKSV